MELYVGVVCEGSGLCEDVELVLWEGDVGGIGDAGIDMRWVAMTMH